MKDLNDLIKPGLFGGAYADNRREEFDIKNGALFRNEVPVDICFIGDSITHFWELNAFFREYGTVINRGIGGDEPHIIAKRFAADVLQLAPRVCVMLAGINSMWPIKDTEDKTSPAFQTLQDDIFDRLMASYLDIMDQAAAAKQTLVIGTVLPIVWPPEVNTFIFRVNARLKELCAERGVFTADLHPVMLGGDALSVNYDYTVDGIHPNGIGYQVMADALKPVLDQLLK